MSGLGKTWWHGSIVNRQDSYGPDMGPIHKRDEEAELAAWEATAAWNGRRWKLDREADVILERGEVCSVQSADAVSLSEGDLIVLAVILLIVSG